MKHAFLALVSPRCLSANLDISFVIWTPVCPLNRNFAVNSKESLLLRYHIIDVPEVLGNNILGSYNYSYDLIRCQKSAMLKINRPSPYLLKKIAMKFEDQADCTFVCYTLNVLIIIALISTDTYHYFAWQSVINIKHWQTEINVIDMSDVLISS